MEYSVISTIISQLSRYYGRKTFISRGDALTVLVQTILSQNTTDTNSLRAFDTLVDTFSSWDAIRMAGLDEIADAIRIGGIENIKAQRIRQTLEAIHNGNHGYGMEFLSTMPLEEARRWLIALPGVGIKTASCVLLFSLGRPALPVDTHVYRVGKRLGLVPADMSVEQAHYRLEELVSADDVYAFHVLIIEHGRKTCRARNPQCGSCVLNSLCPSAGLLTAERYRKRKDNEQ